jgi:hypothetical protein
MTLWRGFSTPLMRAVKAAPRILRRDNRKSLQQVNHANIINATPLRFAAHYEHKRAFSHPNGLETILLYSILTILTILFIRRF